jgi:hypothetical protein
LSSQAWTAFLILGRLYRLLCLLLPRLPLRCLDVLAGQLTEALDNTVLVEAVEFVLAIEVFEVAFVVRELAVDVVFLQDLQDRSIGFAVVGFTCRLDFISSAS